MAKPNTVVRRIDKELNDLLEELAKKNELGFRQASKEVAKILKASLKTKKIVREIRF